jgi:hypothetical protein
MGLGGVGQVLVRPLARDLVCAPSTVLLLCGKQRLLFCRSAAPQRLLAHDAHVGSVRQQLGWLRRHRLSLCAAAIEGESECSQPVVARCKPNQPTRKGAPYLLRRHRHAKDVAQHQQVLAATHRVCKIRAGPQHNRLSSILGRGGWQLAQAAWLRIQDASLGAQRPSGVQPDVFGQHL